MDCVEPLSSFAETAVAPLLDEFLATAGIRDAGRRARDKVRRMTVVCALCGTETTGVVPSQMEPGGPADFDTRPGEPLRSTIGDWVQACPNCGYCADDISRASEGVAEIVGSPVYRAYLEDSSL